MGSRYYLKLDCAYCGELNKDVYYAPTSGFHTFNCGECEEKNFITPDHKSKKLEEATFEEFKEGFSLTTNRDLSEEELDRICRKEFEGLKD